MTQQVTDRFWQAEARTAEADQYQVEKIVGDNVVNWLYHERER